MPAAKNTTVRYYIINQCLTSKVRKYWSIEEFIRKLEENDIRVSVRTVLKDIEDMRYDNGLGYKAPIKHSKGNGGYYYTNPNYSIDAINLSEEQLKSFDFVINCLHEYKDLKIMHEFRGAIDKLAGLFSQFRKARNTKMIEFEKAPYYKGLELRDPIVAFMENKQTVTIHYTTFGRSYPIKHIIHPYVLREYRNRFYLVGLLQAKQKIITLALDRMDKVEPATIPYIEDESFSSNQYFKNFLGVTCAEGEVSEIILACNASLANYFKTIHLHESQEIIHEDKNGIHIRLKLIPNYELISNILSYGKDIRVLQPVQLREQIKQTLLETLKQYE